MQPREAEQETDHTECSEASDRNTDRQTAGETLDGHRRSFGLSDRLFVLHDGKDSG